MNFQGSVHSSGLVGLLLFSSCCWSFLGVVWGNFAFKSLVGLNLQKIDMEGYGIGSRYLWASLLSNSQVGIKFKNDHDGYFSGRLLGGVQLLTKAVLSNSFFPPAVATIPTYSDGQQQAVRNSRISDFSFRVNSGEKLIVLIMIPLHPSVINNIPMKSVRECLGNYNERSELIAKEIFNECLASLTDIGGLAAIVGVMSDGRIQRKAAGNSLREDIVSRKRREGEAGRERRGGGIVPSPGMSLDHSNLLQGSSSSSLYLSSSSGDQEMATNFSNSIISHRPFSTFAFISLDSYKLPQVIFRGYGEGSRQLDMTIFDYENLKASIKSTHPGELTITMTGGAIVYVKALNSGKQFPVDAERYGLDNVDPTFERTLFNFEKSDNLLVVMSIPRERDRRLTLKHVSSVLKGPKVPRLDQLCTILSEGRGEGVSFIVGLMIDDDQMRFHRLRPMEEGRARANNFDSPNQIPINSFSDDEAQSLSFQDSRTESSLLLYSDTPPSN